MEFESDGEAIALAALGKMKVLSVHYAGAYLKSNTDIVAVYRTLLKRYKPSQIAMFGISGGCQLAANTAAWLPSQKLPFPAALGLLSCAGGGSPGDTRNTMNGFDPQLSDFTPFGAARGSRGTQPAVKPGDPEREILNVASIPKGFPPSYLLAGTRDMCLSETALLHRKLRDADVEADLNVFEGIWHAFNIEPNLPETKRALADLARFLDQHMGI
jgi:monoterpene epsilon-lactone hydrolase